MKQCRTCKIWKSLNQFHPKKEAADKHEYRCKSCERKRAREWAARPEVKEKRKIYHRDRYRNTEAGKRSCMKQYLKKQYGLALRKYDQMLETQKGVCDICKQPETITTMRLEKLGGCCAQNVILLLVMLKIIFKRSKTQ
jgi:hypothetical protein